MTRSGDACLRVQQIRTSLFASLHENDRAGEHEYERL